MRRCMRGTPFGHCGKEQGALADPMGGAPAAQALMGRGRDAILIHLAGILTLSVA